MATTDVLRANLGALTEPPLLITGMSGAGLSTAAKVFEDKGWYVAQNLPPAMILELVHACAEEDSPVTRVAVVADVRARMFRGSLLQTLAELRARGQAPTILFLDARDDVLIKRFDSVRRTHPLQGQDTLGVGIDRERHSLEEVRQDADLIIDTSETSVHDLRRRIERTFGDAVKGRPHVTIQSFGFKHGAPRDSDITVDVRFLPNPFWVPELRDGRGTEGPVADYVLAQPGAERFVRDFLRMFDSMQPGYRHEGKNFMTVSVGCTGGHHRSVAIAEEIGRRIAEAGRADVTVVHRDINRS